MKKLIITIKVAGQVYVYHFDKDESKTLEESTTQILNTLVKEAYEHGGATFLPAPTIDGKYIILTVSNVKTALWEIEEIDIDDVITEK